MDGPERADRLGNCLAVAACASRQHDGGPLLACLPVTNDERTSTMISPGLGLRWLPVPCLLAACLTACFADVVQPGPYAYADDAGPMTAPSATTQPTGATPDAGSPPSATTDASLPTAEASDGPTSPCDLTGRWIATDREVSTGLGAQEADHIGSTSSSARPARRYGHPGPRLRRRSSRHLGRRRERRLSEAVARAC